LPACGNPSTFWLDACVACTVTCERVFGADAARCSFSQRVYRWVAEFLTKEGYGKMKRMITLSAALSVYGMFLVSPGAAQAPPPQSPHIGHYIGSALLSVFYVPYKGAVCLSGQVLGGAAYVMTAGVPGNYSGESNGAGIGTVAAASCAGSWVITPGELNRNYIGDLESDDYTE